MPSSLVYRAFAIDQEGVPGLVPCPFQQAACWSRFCILAVASEGMVGSEMASEVTTTQLGLHGIESCMNAWRGKHGRESSKTVLGWVKSKPLACATLGTDDRRPGAPDGPPKARCPLDSRTSCCWRPSMVNSWHNHTKTYCVQAHTDKRKGPATIELLWLQEWMKGESWFSDILSAKAGASSLLCVLGRHAHTCS